MGWGTRRNVHTDARNLKGDRGGRLHGYSKKGVTTTVAVDPGTVDAHQSVQVIVTILGAAPTRHHVIVCVPPADLELGLHYKGAQITGADEVTLTIENRTGFPIEAISRNWTATFFSRTGTV